MIVRSLWFATPFESRCSTYSFVLTLGNALMLAALVGLLISVVIGYSHAQYFSMTSQLVAHILMILSATAVKIGYLMRCIGRHGLGNRQL